MGGFALGRAGPDAKLLEHGDGHFSSPVSRVKFLYWPRKSAISKYGPPERKNESVDCSRRPFRAVRKPECIKSLVEFSKAKVSAEVPGPVIFRPGTSRMAAMFSRARPSPNSRRKLFLFSRSASLAVFSGEDALSTRYSS